jgi:glycosyltransferase involved in cell wall biosynthesis
LLQEESGCLPQGEVRERLRIAIVYDCLYPHTIGGAERWYRRLAGRLAERHKVTYVTRNQWGDGEEPDTPPLVKVVGLGKYSPLYTNSGRRRIAPPLWFGWRVLIHLLRNRRHYDVVHTCNFPFFPLLFASAAGWAGGPPIVTDWIEVWPPDYWNSYLGRIGGPIGAAIQHLCVRATGQAFTLSEVTALALRRAGYQCEPVVLRGLFDTQRRNVENRPCEPGQRPPLVVYVGRHIREKHVTAIPAAIAAARASVPGLRAIIFGDGPERPAVLSQIDRYNMADFIKCPGFVDWTRIDRALSQATCLLLPSEREGYGLVVLEAAVHGTPSILVEGPNNAATRLVEHGVNGIIACSTGPTELAAAIVAIWNDRAGFIARTRNWFKEHEAEFGMENSLFRIEECYRAAIGGSRKSKA